MIYAGSNAKRKPGSRRAAPRLVPLWALFLAALLGPAGILTPQPYGRIMGATALTISLAWIIQRFRHAGWVVTTGAERELNR